MASVQSHLTRGTWKLGTWPLKDAATEEGAEAGDETDTQERNSQKGGERSAGEWTSVPGLWLRTPDGAQGGPACVSRGRPTGRGSAALTVRTGHLSVSAGRKLTRSSRG